MPEELQFEELSAPEESAPQELKFEDLQPVDEGPDVLREQTLREKLRYSAVGRALLGPSSLERMGMVRPPLPTPVEIPERMLEFTSLPPQAREPIRKVTDVGINLLPPAAAGVATGLRETALQLPVALGAVKLASPIGKLVMGVFAGQYIINTPESKRAFDAARARGDDKTAYSIATQAALGGALTVAGTRAAFEKPAVPTIPTPEQATAGLPEATKAAEEAGVKVEEKPYVPPLDEQAELQAEVAKAFGEEEVATEESSLPAAVTGEGELVAPEQTAQAPSKAPEAVVAAPGEPAMPEGGAKVARSQGDVAEKWIREQLGHIKATYGKLDLDHQIKMLSERIRDPKWPIKPEVREALMHELKPTFDMETGETLDITSPDWPRTGTIINFLESRSQGRIPDYDSISRGGEKENLGVEATERGPSSRGNEVVQTVQGAAPTGGGGGAGGGGVKAGVSSARPSLGRTVSDIYRGWENTDHLNNERVVGYIPAYGEFDWQGGKLWRLGYDRKNKVSVREEATQADLEEIDRAINNGTLQVEVRSASGFHPTANKGRVVRVVHQATGRPLGVSYAQGKVEETGGVPAVERVPADRGAEEQAQVGTAQRGGPGEEAQSELPVEPTPDFMAGLAAQRPTGKIGGILWDIKQGRTSGLKAKVLMRPVGDTRGLIEINGEKFVIDDTERLRAAGIETDYSSRKTPQGYGFKTEKEMIEGLSGVPRLAFKDFQKSKATAQPLSPADSGSEKSVQPVAPATREEVQATEVGQGIKTDADEILAQYHRYKESGDNVGAFTMKRVLERLPAEEVDAAIERSISPKPTEEVTKNEPEVQGKETPVEQRPGETAGGRLAFINKQIDELESRMNQTKNQSARDKIARAIDTWNVQKRALEIGLESPAPSDGRIKYIVPATGGAKRFVKVSGQWFRESGGKPVGRAIDPSIKLVPALDRTLIEQKVRQESGSKLVESPERSLSTLPAVKVKVPEGATQIRITTPQGKKAVQSVASVNKGDNPFRGVDIKKVEAGTIDKKGKFSPLKSQEGLSVGPGIQIKVKGGETGAISLPPVGPAVESALAAADRTRHQFTTLFKSGSNRKVMDQTMDAAENQARITAQQAARSLQLRGNKADQDAAFAVVEANGDRSKLAQFYAQTRGYKRGEDAVRLASRDWDRLQPLAAEVKRILDRQIAEENNSGINTEYHEAYVPHLIDQDLLMGVGRPYVLGGRGGGVSTSFKKGRAFDTIFDAIEEGYRPKSMNVADLVEHRVKTGQMLMNRKGWSDGLRGVVDPSDGNPLVTDLQTKTRPNGASYQVAPAGYTPREIIPGVRIAVHEGYASLFDALTGTSHISSNLPGRALLATGGGIKHGLLAFDTFHASRIMQKELFLTGRISYKRGISLLEYSDRDLVEAVRQGVMSQEIADWARANRPTAELLVKNGLNVGRIQEGLAADWLNKWFITKWNIGAFKNWVFDKLTRGAILQSGLLEFERVSRAQPNLSAPEVARKVSRDLNAYFGNLGRQGVFKSATAQDLSRVVLLAPQWVESMVRTELKGAGQIAKGLTYDPVVHKTVLVGTLGKGVAQGVFAYFVGTQILNLLTRHQFTFQNQEPGHKLDAWIPDWTGKSPGFFISPFAVAAEVSHDVIRYLHSEPSAIAAAARILSNKAAPIVRASQILGSGKTFSGEKLIGSWDRAKAAAVSLLPLPIPAQAPIKGAQYPGQTQRQLTASLGFKTEPAATAQNELRYLFTDWMSKQNDPKIAHEFERRQQEDFGVSDYRKLRYALYGGNMKIAREEYDKLVTIKGGGSKAKEIIRNTMNPRTEEGLWKPVVGTRATERKFRESLDDSHKAVYEQARQDRLELYRRFRRMLAEK